MDAGGWCGKRFQIRERSGGAESLFLRASAPEFLARGRFVYPSPAERGDDGDGAGARGPHAGSGPGALRGDHAARASGSLDVAADGGRNASWCSRRIGAAPRYYRTLWRDVLCGVAEHARVGAAHGAWSERIQSLAPGHIARLGVNGRGGVVWRRGGVGVAPNGVGEPFYRETTPPPALP